MNENTKEWEQYQKGLDYKSKIHLRPTMDKNERFYSGKQWEGVKSNGLPTPVLNIVKRISDFKISSVMAEMVAMQFSAEGIADDAEDEKGKMYREAAKLMSDYSRTAWEKLKVDTMNEDGLLDAIQSGDMVSFWYWDPTIDCGDGMFGDMVGELIDNVNYMPGDPNNPEINNVYGPVQPYIILAFRRQVKETREEAKENGASEEDLLKITADSETQNQAGDRSKEELDPDGDEGKCIVLLKLWPQKEGNQKIIMAKKCTRMVTVRDEWSTDLHRYPVALMNWSKRKGSAHGEPDITSMIPNQILINQMAAMIALWVKLHGFPKVIYDKTRVENWDNNIASAIAVNGTDGGGVGGAAQYMLPAQLSAAVQRFMEWFIQVTKEMAGANEAVLGESNPTNTSAIIVLQKATAVPLNSVKRRFYRYIEDLGLIWLDFWISKYSQYPKRNLEIMQKDIKTIVNFDASALAGARFKLKIDVGPSTEWNEAATVQTLDNLIMKDLITFVEYLERLPKDMIPDKQGLIDARGDDTDMALLYELIAMFARTLPPEQQQMLQGMSVEQAKDQIKQMLLGTVPNNQQSAQQPVQQPEPARPYANNVEGVV